jgi:1,4-dihydroxy-2-naphthoate octaprenyltransferase
MLAGFFGLVIGAHYIDIAGSREKYLPYFPKMNRAAIRAVGVLAVLAGIGVGVYMSLIYSIWFLVFVVLGGFFALFYPIEKPKWLHSYTGFGIAWGFMPVLASYYIQGLRIDLVGVGLAVFLGITVVEMHHMAVLTNEREYAAETNKNARLLLKLHRAAAYAIGLILLIARLA